MKSVKRVWVLGGLGAFVLGMGAAACATSLGTADAGSTGTTPGVDAAGTGCAALTACCSTLSAANAAQCPAVLAKDSDSACASFLSQITSSGLCLGSGSGSGTGVVIVVPDSGGTGLGSSTGSGTGTSTGSSTGSGSGGVDASTGTDAGTGSGSGSSSGSGTGSGTGTGTGASDGGSGAIPTTCAEANGNIGCCASNGKEYYCATGSTTVKAVTCASGKVCTWNASSSYYGCETGTVGKADPSGDNPLECQ